LGFLSKEKIFWKLFLRDCVVINMSATDLQNENERLKTLLSQTQAELSQAESELSEKQTQISTLESKLEESQTQQTAVVEQFTQTIEQKNRSISQLEHQIKLLLQQIRGSRQERIDPDQLTLFTLEELQQISDELQQGDPDDELIQTGTRKSKRRRGRQGKLPEYFDREVIRYELEERERACPCCGELRHEIDVESSEQLELIPAKLKVFEHQRVKYACRNCQKNGESGQLAIADKPPQPIEKGLPAPGLCSYTILSKFGDHIPFYRIEDITSRWGFTIRRSTLCGWQAELADLVLPLVMRMKFLLLQSKVIHTDDTSIKLLEGGPARTAKLWPYLGDWLHLPAAGRPVHRVRFYADPGA